MPIPHPETLRAERLQATFAADFAAREIKWSAYNLSRLLRLTGERPPRLAAMRKLLGALGLGHFRTCLNIGGVFDHGTFWGRQGEPWALVGHPYRLDDAHRQRLAELAGFGTLAVAIDDRPSFYGWGTHHLRIELVEPRKPWDSIRSTPRTRAARRAARAAFAEAGLPPLSADHLPAPSET